MLHRTTLLAATALASLPLAAMAGDVTFEAVPFAGTDAAKRQVLASAGVSVNVAGLPLSYHLLARTGDKLGANVFGSLTDKDGKTVVDRSDNPDFTSILKVGSKMFSITHFEDRPGGMYLTELNQDAEGNLSYGATKPIDFSAVGGLWVPCAGSVTPWGTHLGSEEYPPDARALEAAKSVDEVDKYVQPMARYWGIDPVAMTLDQFRAAFNPYRYGFPVEITVTEDGNATPAKHYAMGRVAVELATVMPDRKTAYVSDDGTNVGLFRFVADKEGDLSAGTLYAAKWTQTSDEGAGVADISWVDLGHADDNTVAAALKKGVGFWDLFETADMGDDGSCPEGFLASNAEGRAECLKVKPGMEALASRLETRRMASMLGATTEFRKMEGQAFDPATRTLYLAMSEIAKGMTAGDKADKGGRDDIRVAKNGCGAVYGLTLDEGFAATKMATVVAGKPLEYAADSPYAGNTCDVEGIASPDNITFIPGYNTLMIGEDTDGHQNDVVWAMDMSSGKLTRVLTSPYGSEVTSLDWYGDVNGHGYLMAVIQHPYGETDTDKLTDPADARGYVGYIGPFPAMGM